MCRQLMKVLVPTLLALAAMTVSRSASASETASMYRDTVRSVVWILNFDDNSSGTGVVFDTDRNLLFTAAHVVGSADTVAIVFPDINRDGNVISDKDYYIADKNIPQRVKDGLVMIGQVIARDRAKDLAIVEVRSLPSGVKAIPLATELPEAGAHLHMIGHPAERPLWNFSLLESNGAVCTHWTWASSKQSVDACIVTVLGDVWHGNSGGPVLNEKGEIVGIVSAGGDSGLRDNFAIDADEMRKMLATLTEFHGLKFTNTTKNTINFAFRWNPDDAWEQRTVGPGETVSFSLPAHVHVQPEMIYDYSFVEGFQKATFPLSTRLTLRGGDMSVGGGLVYEFRDYGSNSIRVANSERE